MNLLEWQINKTKSFKENAKAALREGAELEEVMHSYTGLKEEHWQEIAEELDAEQYVKPLVIDEATDVSNPVMISSRIAEYADFIPDNSGDAYWLTFVTETAFLNEHANVLAGMQDALGTDVFEISRVDEMSIVTFKDVIGFPVTRRTHKLQEQLVTLAVIEPALTITDVKRSAIRERIYGE